MELRLDDSVTPARLMLAGEMTIYAAADLKAPLLDALLRHPALEVNLSAISEIDTAGLQLLVLAKREAAGAGRVFSLAGHSRPVQELIELYGLAAFFGDPLLVEPATAGGGA